MGDNSTQGGADTVATDELTASVNGVATGAPFPKAQRMKIDSAGVDGAFRDASPTFPFPVRPILESEATFRGRASTFRMVGRAGTAPRRLLALWNALGSGKVVHINQVAIDVFHAAAYAVATLPPIIRPYRITSIPTNGTALAKVSKDSLLTSSGSISLFQDASADGTNSATALAATPVGTHLSQVFAPRLITAAGYEMFDREELLEGKDVVLRAGEGIVLSYDGITAVGQEPATMHSIATVDWYETN
jgi:hypothetical protein